MQEKSSKVILKLNSATHTDRQYIVCAYECDDGSTIRVVAYGEFDDVLCLCSEMLGVDGVSLAIDENARETIQRYGSEATRKGFQVVMMASRSFSRDEWERYSAMNNNWSTD